MTDFLFNGYYGYRNTGDDVFCVVADWGSRKYWGARDLAFVATELPVLSQPAHAIIPTARRYPGQQTVSRTLSGMGARHMVYFGGSTLHSPQELWVNLLRQTLVQKVGRKSIAAAGVSVGPFKSAEGEREIRKLISEMSYIAVRDRASFDIVKAMNVETPVIQSFDPALLMLDVMADSPPPALPQRATGRPVIGVSVCNVERYHGGDVGKEQRRVASVKATVKALAAEGFALRFFVFNGHAASGDEAVTDEVIASLDGYPHVEKLPYCDDPKVVYAELSRCDAIFGVRLHACILAYTAGVPFILVEYHRKCGDFLDEIGYTAEGRVGDATVDPVETARRLTRLAAEGRPHRLCARSVDDSRELARVNFTAAPYCEGRR
ncbi:polysaccharide pyruvyl transferase family protein [Roseateles amylovorans]|uniref:Polysaccharide pyruvyl transferase family protein n=1 Tax=Roseateles amylovorans TaxID=2978473 RepID=A0ABY6B2P9_9BURK|nr:polysaccharide pyruvyl transferase family protein [Roseateles amylovorans]UXH79499.1 polysaccharide pyruvyl transferase family protein [Roseateles amylovorans]